MFVGQFYVKVFNIILQLLLSNILGAKGYGIYSLGINSIHWLRHFSQLGLQNGVLRFIPVHLSQGRKENVRGTIWGALLLSSAASLAFGTGLWIFSSDIASMFFHHPPMEVVLRGLALGLPLIVPFWISMAVMRALHAIGSLTASLIFRSFAQLALLLGGAAVGFRLGGAIFAFGASAGLGLVFSISRIYRVVPLFEGGIQWEIRRLLRFSLPVCFAGMSYLLMARLDLLLIGHFLDPRSAGLYRACVAAAGLVQLPMMLLNTTFAPMISELHSNGNMGELKKLYKTVTRWTILSAALVGVLLLTAGSGFLMLFGEDFASALPTLRLLVVFQLMVLSLGSVGFMLQMTGHQDWVMIHAALSSGCNVVLNLVLIPKWGIIGAALATGISLLINQGLNFIHVAKRMHIHPWDSQYWPIIWGLISSASSYFTILFLGLKTPIPWIVPPVVYLIIAIAWGIKEEDHDVLNLLLTCVIHKKKNDAG